MLLTAVNDVVKVERVFYIPFFDFTRLGNLKTRNLISLENIIIFCMHVLMVDTVFLRAFCQRGLFLRHCDP